MDNEIVWQIPEYEYRRKGSSWFWWSLAAALALIIFAGWQRNFLFAVFVAIAFFLVNYMTDKFPPIWRIRLNKEGVFIERPEEEVRSAEEEAAIKFFPFEKIEGYDIHRLEGRDYQNLVFKVREKFSPFLKVNIYSEDQKDIENFLSHFLRKEEYPRQISESLAELIGF